MTALNRESFFWKEELISESTAGDSRLVSTQENYPRIGTDKNIFLCVKVISSNPELTENLSCPFQSTDNFPEWKLAFNLIRAFIIV